MPFADQQGMQSPRGIMVLRPEARERIIGGQPDGFALFSITQSGCQLRIYPEMNAQGQALPIRAGRELSDIGLWVCGDHFGIRYLGGNDPGKEKVTMLLTVEGDTKCSDPSQRRGLRVWDQLRNTLYYRLNDGTAPSHWSRWAANARGATLGPSTKSKAKPFALVRGMLTHYVGGEGRPIRSISPQAPKLNCVLLAPPAAQSALIELTMKELDAAKNYQGDDYDQVFMYNSKLVHPQTGCLINFGCKGMSDPRVAQQAQAPAQVNFGSASGAGGGQDDDQYKVEATVLDFAPYQPVPIPMEYLQRFCVQPWDDILEIWKDEADLLRALEVGFPDDLIMEAFKDEPGLLSDRLRAKLQQSDIAARAGSLGVPGVTPVVPGAVPAPAAAVSIPPTVAPVTAPAVPAAATVPIAAPAVDKAPWEGSGTPPSGVNVPDPNPGAPAAPAGAQPDGTAPQGMNDMMAALKNADPSGPKNPAPGTQGS